MDDLLPPGDLFDVDIISNIRCGLFSFLSQNKVALEKYRMAQRVSLFYTLDEGIKSLNSASKLDIISAIEAKKQNSLQWCSQIRNEISPLLVDAQKLIKNIT